MHSQFERQSDPQLIPTRTATGLCVALLAALWLAWGAPALAADYFVFGQVLQVDPLDAEDEAIPDAALTGENRPYSRVRVYDQASGLPLGEADSDENGVFTVQYTQPAGATPDLVVRVFHRIQESSSSTLESQVLPAAREGINEFTSVGQFQGVVLKVLADDSLSYGSAGFVSTPGVGLVFTRVGRVETQFITQNTSTVGGLADFSSDPAAPGHLGVPDFRQAPFAGRLLVYGDFGLPSNTPACTGMSIDYYRVVIERVGGAASQWDQPLFKTRTVVTTVPSLSVSHHREQVGPFAGSLAGPPTPVDGLYLVNRNSTGGVTNTFWSFPDLRINWLTTSWAGGAANGLYEISVEYYSYVAGPADAPQVTQIPAACFTPPSAPVGTFLIRVDNGALTATFDGIFLRDAMTGDYLRDPNLPIQPGDTATETPAQARALDFNGTGLCEIMDLESRRDVEIHATVSHAGQYLRSWSLTAAPNDGGAAVSFGSDSFTAHTSAVDPLWAGPGSLVLSASGFSDCAYIFDLVATSRQQNGVQFVQRVQPRRTYYVLE